MTDWQRRRYEDARKAYDALMKFYPLTLENLDGEQWADIAGYEGLYQESTFGRTKSFYNDKAIILKPQLSNKGYLYVGLHKAGKIEKLFVHVLVAKTFIPNPDGKPEVNHVCGNPLNCHVSNLEWMTHEENIQHAVRIGLKKSGADHSEAKFDEEQIVYIRDNPDNLTGRELAVLFNVHVMTISNIQLGKTYKNAGGRIRGKFASHPNQKYTDELREKIRAEYIKGDKDFGAHALGRKYGMPPQVVWKIATSK